MSILHDRTAADLQFTFPFEFVERNPADAEPSTPEALSFVAWLFWAANEILDDPDPRRKWLAERVSQLAYRARFFGAHDFMEYDAIEAEQERWLADRDR